MNKEEIIARPYEEYYEMIKDMAKDNMIQGLYDLSKECIEKQNYINQLETNRDEVINIIKNHIGCEKALDGILLFPTKKIIDVLERGKDENAKD